MKFRCLSDKELKELEEEFKKFLVTSDVSSVDWEEMNANAPDKAHKLVELFSDMVFQKVFESIQYLEHRSERDLKVFHCAKDKMELIAVKAPSSAKVDLSTPQSIQDSLLNHSGDLEFFTAEKPYSKEREVELYEMTIKGCVGSNEAFWRMLEKVVGQ